jgi:hypothetical protein
MDEKRIDELLRELETARAKRAFSDEQRNVLYREQIRLVVEDLQRLKDLLAKSGQSAPVDKSLVAIYRKHLEKRMAEDPTLGGVGKAVVKSGPADKSARPPEEWGLFLDPDIADKAIAHRREMNKRIVEAIAKMRERLESMLADKQTFKTHYRIEHRRRKIDAKILLWNYRHWDLKDRATAGPVESPSELEWLKAELEKDLEPTSPSSKLMKKPEPSAPALAEKRQKKLKSGLGGLPDPASKLIYDLERLRKNLVVIRQALVRCYNEAQRDVSSWSPTSIELNIGSCYAEVVNSAIVDDAIFKGMVFYSTAKLPNIFAGIIPVEEYEVERYSDPEAPDATTTRFVLYDRLGRRGGSRAQSEFLLTEQWDKLPRGHFLRHPKDGLADCKQQWQHVLEYERGRSERWRPGSKAFSNLLGRVERGLQEAHEIVFDLQKTKYDKDNPNRYIDAVRDMKDSEKKVTELVAAWQENLDFCRLQYREIFAPLKDDSEAEYRFRILDTIGRVLDSSLFLTAEKQELLQAVESCLKKPTGLKLDDADVEVNHWFGGVKDSVWPRWFRFDGHWIRWEKDASFPPDNPQEDDGLGLVILVQWAQWGAEQTRSFREHVASVPADAFEDVRFLLKMILEKEMIELAHLSALARGDASVRAEIPWQAYAEQMEGMIAQAQGIIVYLKRLDDFYRFVRWLVKKVLRANFKEQYYPSVGEAKVSISVALKLGGSFDLAGGVAKIGASLGLTLQIAGSINQQDDRRLRFSGSFNVKLKGGASTSFAPSKLLDQSSTAAKVLSGKGVAQSGLQIEGQWLGAKVGMAFEKGLLAYSRGYTYVDEEHLAASWAHRLAQVYLWFSAGVHAVPGLFDGTKAVKVINPRELGGEEEALLKLMAGEQYKRVLEYIQKPVAVGVPTYLGLVKPGQGWQGSFDLEGRLGPLGGRFHAENLVHKQTKSKKWRHAYTVLDDKAKRYRKSASAPEEHWVHRVTVDTPGSDDYALIVKDVWSKSYPPNFFIAQSLAANANDAASQPSSNFFDVFTNETSKGSDTVFASVGVQRDILPTYGVTFTRIENDTASDNDGMYLTLSTTRSTGVSVGSDMAGTSLGLSINWSARPTVNRLELRNLFRHLAYLGDRISGTAGLKADTPENCQKVLEHAMQGLWRSKLKGLLAQGYGAVLKEICKFGDFDLNFIHSDLGDRPHWALQYGRVNHTLSWDVSASIPTPVPYLSVEGTLKYDKTDGVAEVLGTDTLTYVQAIWGGLAGRPAEVRVKYWEAYKNVHLPELLAMCFQLGRRGAAQSGSSEAIAPSNAYLEVQADTELARPLDTEGKKKETALKQAAQDLLDACALPDSARQALLEVQTPPSKPQKVTRILRATRIATTTARVQHVAAVAVTVINELTGEIARCWPDVDGQPMKADSPIEYFFVGPQQLNRIVCALENLGGIQSAKVEIYSHTDTGKPVWDSELVKDGKRTDLEAPSDDDEEELIPVISESTSEDDDLEPPFQADPSETVEAPPPSQTPVTPPDDGRVKEEFTVLTRWMPELKKIGSQAYDLITVKFPPAEALDPELSPFELRLTVEAKSTAQCDQPTSHAFLHKLKPGVLETFEAYLEAKRQYQPYTQSSEWRKVGTHANVPWVICSDDVGLLDAETGSLTTDPPEDPELLGSDEDKEESAPPQDIPQPQVPPDSPPPAALPDGTLKTGLKNLGNTCYFNSTLKLIAAAPELDPMFANALNQAAPAITFFQRNLESLIQSIREADKNLTASNCLAGPLQTTFSMLRQAGWRYPLGQEQDAQELLLTILNMFDNKVYPLQIGKKFTPVKDLAYAVARERTSFVSEKLETHTSLSVPVDAKHEGKSLQLTIDDYFAPEQISDFTSRENGFVKDEVMRQFYLERAPAFFLYLSNCLELGSDRKKMFKLKLADELRLPVGVPGDDARHPGHAVLEPWAIIRHIGDRISTGHYVMYQRVQSGEWILHNDSADPKVVPRTDADESDRNNNYVVLYRAKAAD